jgi:hypothetical protein
MEDANSVRKSDSTLRRPRPELGVAYIAPGQPSIATLQARPRKRCLLTSGQFDASIRRDPLVRSESSSHSLCRPRTHSWTA